jgi:ribA/ribD-fused uncharacterized protein
MTVKFYSTRGEYGCFSNFSRHAVVIGGKRYPTTEAYYQAQKFMTTEPAYAEEIRKTNNPKIAAQLGRDKKKPLRRDWEKIKDNVMRQALAAKAEQHPEVKEALMATVGEKIVEDSPSDYYWGCGADGSGKNRLGQLWMELRDKIIKEESDV